MIRVGDIFIAALAVIIVAALAANIYSTSSVSTVQIMGADRAIHEYPAWADRTVRIAGPLGETRIEIHDGKARVVASPCSQKLCIRAGWLEFAGAATACAPNHVSVALLGNDPRFDAMNF